MVHLCTELYRDGSVPIRILSPLLVLHHFVLSTNTLIYEGIICFSFIYVPPPLSTHNPSCFMIIAHSHFLYNKLDRTTALTWKMLSNKQTVSCLWFCAVSHSVDLHLLHLFSCFSYLRPLEIESQFHIIRTKRGNTSPKTSDRSSGRFPKMTTSEQSP